MSSPRRVAAVPQDELLANGDEDINGEIVVDDNGRATPPKVPKSPTQTQSTTSMMNSPFGQAPSSPINFDFSGVIQPQDLLELAACPCCKQCIDERQHQTLTGTGTTTPTTGNASRMVDPYSKSAFDSESVDSDDEDTLPRGVAEGLNYLPKRILVEGWVHKKGTGKDWLGSRSWKPRWARLVMAKLEGCEVDVPLLMIYWYAGTSTPSNVIILDSTVAFQIDMEDKERWDAFRFDIRNAKTIATNTAVSRTFCAPKKARDAWIYAISQALLVYEKENDKARKATILQTRRAISPQPSMLLNRPRSPPHEQVWSEDRFVSSGKNSPTNKGLSSPPRMPSPPTSPTSPTARNPRPRATKRTVPRGPTSPHVPKQATEKC